MPMNRRPRSNSDNAAMVQKFHDEDALRAVEKAIRRIVRAHDLRSRALVKTRGVTAAQLTLLRGVKELGEVTSAALSAYADVSPATVVTILDNLEWRGLIERYRSGTDRRIVHTRLTLKGEEILNSASDRLGADFMERFLQLEGSERRQLVKGITMLADMLARDRVLPPGDR